MNAYAQALTGLYAKHNGAIRGAMYALIMMGILTWIFIGNTVPSHAATMQVFSVVQQDITDPIKPDSTSIGEAATATVLRIFGVVLWFAAAVALFAAIGLIIKYSASWMVKSERAAESKSLKGIFILLAIFGILTVGGTAVFVGAASILGEVFSL